MCVALSSYVAMLSENLHAHDVLLLVMEFSYIASMYV